MALPCASSPNKWLVTNSGNLFTCSFLSYLYLVCYRPRVNRWAVAHYGYIVEGLEYVSCAAAIKSPDGWAKTAEQGMAMADAMIAAAHPPGDHSYTATVHSLCGYLGHAGT